MANHSDDYEDFYPFPSPRIISKFHFPSPFLFRFCVSRILNRFQRHMYSELQISSARRGRAVFTPLLSSHRRRCCRSSSLLLLFFCFFFPLLLKFWTELSESVHAAVSACIERRENESNILKEYNEGRISAVRSISIPNILFLFYSMRNNYTHLNPN